MSYIYYKSQIDFQQRRNDASNRLEEFPTLIPIIVEKSRQSSLNTSNLLKLQFPRSKSYHIFLQKLRQIMFQNLQETQFRQNQNQNQVLFLHFQTKIMYSPDTPMSQIYDQQKDQDGFLYIKYSEQEHLGGSK